MTTDEQINRENVFHGARWNQAHEGYFSDPAVAAPLVQKIRDLARQSEPETIIDLGGGTGALLSQLRMSGAAPGATWVDLDASPDQLDVARAAGFACLQGSVESFSRHEMPFENNRTLFLMRSVLHYFGQEGLRRVLRHIRALLRPGEFFVHQTASFKRQQDADCLNTLYHLMRTPKWYPTVDTLCGCLREEGWRVLEVCPAPSLRLRSDDLMSRYDLDETDVRRILEDPAFTSAVPDDVFQKNDRAFCAYLHYSIYVCSPG
jgi:SAM-dependent methyltransferase